MFGIIKLFLRSRRNTWTQWRQNSKWSLEYTHAYSLTHDTHFLNHFICSFHFIYLHKLILENWWAKGENATKKHKHRNLTDEIRFYCSNWNHIFMTSKRRDASGHLICINICSDANVIKFLKFSKQLVWLFAGECTAKAQPNSMLGQSGSHLIEYIIQTTNMLLNLVLFDDITLHAWMYAKWKLSRSVSCSPLNRINLK